MSFDGSGNYTPPAPPNFPAVGGTPIASAYYNSVIADVAAALSICITRDGQGKPSANIDWNNKNLSNVNALTAASLTLGTALGVAYGGTGLTAVPANGQIPIGNGVNFTLASISGGGGITVTPGAGSISLTFSGAITSTGLTINTGKLAGRTTAGSGAVEEIAIGPGLSMAGGILSVSGIGASPAKLTMNNGGAGDASGAQFDTSVAKTLSWNTIGAQPDSPRIDTAASGNLTPDFSHDISIRTGLAANITISNPVNTGNGRGHVIRLKDNGSSRNINFGGQYRAVGVTLPSATTSNKVLYIGCIWNDDDSKVDVVSVQQQ